MKRIRVMLGLLLLGAILNVAVAWGCALWSPLGEMVSVEDESPEYCHHLDRFSDDMYVPILQRKGIGLNFVVFQSRVPLETHLAWLYEAGWPAIALSGRTDQDRGAAGCLTPPQWLRPRSFPSPPRYLPIDPHWPGVLANSLLMAAILWFLQIGVRQLHRLIRLKRGVCVQCAYDLRGTDHEACPECGAPTNKATPV